MAGRAATERAVRDAQRLGALPATSIQQLAGSAMSCCIHMSTRNSLPRRFVAGNCKGKILTNYESAKLILIS